MNYCINDDNIIDNLVVLLQSPSSRKGVCINRNELKSSRGTFYNSQSYRCRW